MAQEPLDPAWVGLAGDERPRAMPERVEAEDAEVGGCRGALEALPQRRAVEWTSETGAEDVVVGADKVLSLSEPRERVRGRTGRSAGTLPASSSSDPRRDR